MSTATKIPYALTLTAGDCVAAQDTIYARSEADARRQAQAAAKSLFREVSAALAVGWRIVTSSDEAGTWSDAGQVA